MSSTTPLSLSGIVARTSAQAPDTPLNKLRVGASPFRSGRSITSGDLPHAIANDIREYEAGPRGGHRLGAAAGAVSYAEAENGLVEVGVKLVKNRARDKNRGINLGDLRAQNNVMLETHVDVHLPSDSNDRAEIHNRFEAMFPDGRLGFMNAASAALGGIRDVEISKADGAQKGMVKVAVTDRATWARFEFFLDDANKRILCGDNFAKWAAKGDPRAKQMSELLIALARSSSDSVLGEKALDRVEFKPGDVDAYALLKKGYGSSCKRGRVQLILDMGVQFRDRWPMLVSSMSSKRYEKAYRPINAIVEKVRNSRTQLSKRNEEGVRILGIDETLFKLAHFFRKADDFRGDLIEGLVARAKADSRDLLRMASNRTRLNVQEVLGDAEEPELVELVHSIAERNGGRVPLGQLLLAMATDKGADWMLWDSRETTRTKPDPMPMVQQAPAAVLHRVRG